MPHRLQVERRGLKRKTVPSFATILARGATLPPRHREPGPAKCSPVNLDWRHPVNRSGRPEMQAALPRWREWLFNLLAVLALLAIGVV